KYLMTSVGASPQEIFALASCSAWVRSTCPGSLTPTRAAAGRGGGGEIAGAIEGGAVAGCRRLPPASAAAKVAFAGTLAAMTESAADVPSAPHTGQATGPGMRPLTGSTSNAYRWPHPH